MGFLSNLFKKEAKKMFSNAITRATNEAIDAFGSTEEKCERSAAAAESASVTSPADTTPNRSTSTNADEEPCYGDYDTVCKRVEKVVATEWIGYELREKIPAKELGAGFGARPYTYGLYLNGVPKAMILIMDGRSSYMRKDTRRSHEACKENNVFCMNLMLHLPNRYSYIAGMLRNNVSR